MSKKTRSNKATRDKSQLDPSWGGVARVFEDRVDAYPTHVEWMWWLWCRITTLAGKLDQLLRRPSVLQPFIVKAEIVAVSFGDEVLVLSDTDDEGYIIRELSDMAREVSGDPYRRIPVPTVTSHHARSLPVAFTLKGGQVLHFCDIDEGAGSMPGVRREAYFQELAGRTVQAAGYVSEGVHTAMALRVEAASEPARDAKYLWLGTAPPVVAPRSVAEAITRRTRDFGQLSCGLFWIYSVSGLVLVFSLLATGRTDGTVQSTMAVLAWALPLLFVVPAVARLVWPLLTLLVRVAGRLFKEPASLPSLPILMKTSQIDQPPMNRLRSYDHSRMTEWLAGALHWPQEPPYIHSHEWSLMDEYIWPWVALLLTLLLWAVVF